MSKKPAKKASKKAAPKSAKSGVKKSARPAAKPAVKKVAKKAAKPGARAASGKAAPSDAMGKRASVFVRFAHKMLADMGAGIPDEQATAQLAGAVNHKLWTIGHMAHSNQWFASLIDGQPITSPAEWDKMFGMGSKPTGDAGAYPPIADLRAALDASVDRMCAAIESRSDAELGAAPAGESGGFITDKMDSALKTAWHYGWHLGQLAALRKGLGLPGMMGG